MGDADEEPMIDLLGLSRQAPVHFMGVGGAGMAPLAELLLRAGGKVSGCDLHLSPTTAALERLGLAVSEGHGEEHLDGSAALIVTAAIPAEHPEIQRAHTLGIPVLKRAAALGSIVNRGTVIGISGTHGKTTTTALTTGVLAAAGLDPTGFVGGRVAGWGGNLRYGARDLFVVEADEYDRSFLQLRPSLAVLTTLEADHLDIFGSLEGVEEAFLTFLRQLPPDGLLVACGDDPGVGRIVPRLGIARPHVLTYGLGAGTMLRAEEVRSRGRECTFLVREHGRLLGEVTIRIPGRHNVRNSLAAIGVARALGAEWEAIVRGLHSYRGVQRRFEEVGDAGEVVLIDDYAHHPSEIAATLQAARASYPERRIVAVFQPHLYSRTRDFAAAFAQQLAAADLLFITDVYAAREAPIAGVSGALIADAARSAGARVHYLPERARVAEAVAAALRPNDLCLTLGAGDLNVAAREILVLIGADARA